MTWFRFGSKWFISGSGFLFGHRVKTSLRVRFKVQVSGLINPGQQIRSGTARVNLGQQGQVQCAGQILVRDDSFKPESTRSTQSKRVNSVDSVNSVRGST